MTLPLLYEWCNVEVDSDHMSVKYPPNSSQVHSIITLYLLKWLSDIESMATGFGFISG